MELIQIVERYGWPTAALIGIAWGLWLFFKRLIPWLRPLVEKAFQAHVNFVDMSAQEFPKIRRLLKGLYLSQKRTERSQVSQEQKLEAIAEKLKDPMVFNQGVLTVPEHAPKRGKPHDPAR